MLNFDPFIQRAIIAGLGIAIIAGTLGCFVVWRKMAYFSDSLAHSALLGVALGVTTGIGSNVATILICTIFASLLIWLQQKKLLATDTLLGILAHSSLSLGMVALGLLNERIDLYAYLFGDILTVSTKEIFWIYGGGVIVFTLLTKIWSSLLLMTINDDLAKAENVRNFLVQLSFMFLMTIIVAVSIRVVGILLISSMLIIPAASARRLAHSPEGMAIISSFLACLAVIIGISFSLTYDTASGPTIVAASSIIFTLTLPISIAYQKLFLKP